MCVFFGFFFGFLLGFLDLLEFFDFGIFLKDFFLVFMDFFKKLLRLLLNVIKVTTRNQNWPKIGQNSIISSFFCLEGKTSLGQSPPQELEVGPHSGP